MNLIWENEHRTIMELTKALADETGWSKHTVITCLKRLEAKGESQIIFCGYQQKGIKEPTSVSDERRSIKESAGISENQKNPKKNLENNYYNSYILHSQDIYAVWI